MAMKEGGGRQEGRTDEDNMISVLGIDNDIVEWVLNVSFAVFILNLGADSSDHSIY
jgi:hypothetical protein